MTDQLKIVTKKSMLSVAIVLIVAGVSTLAVVGYLGSSQRNTTLVYANSALLYETWSTYKSSFLAPGTGRTIDHSQPGNITTSEGESYTMLRAVWMDDEPVFKQSLAFSEAYMARPDHLFSWRYSQLPSGSYGINQSNGNVNTASDGDTQIALALLMAYSRWGQSYYLTTAQQIIHSMWQQEVVTIGMQPVMTADNLEKLNQSFVTVDPSYLNPAAYKLFAKVDPIDNWNGLASASYQLLQSSMSNPLGASRSSGLPPDWIEVNRKTGAIQAPAANLDTNFGYDAFRVPFNLALDYEWFHDPRDIQTLSKMSFLKSQWDSKHYLAAVYAHDGKVVAGYQDPAMYGATIGFFIMADPSDARSLYQEKLETLYNPNTQSWQKNLNYYASNWAWFGIALYNHDLPNLTQPT